MAFSLRSFFGKGGSTAEAIAPTPTPAEGTLPEADAAGPGFANSMLFKSAGADTPLGQPVAGSPFSLAPGPGASELTIADLLPCLPADIAKDPGLPQGYPVTLPEPVLESALRSGRASIPLFEIFRACPSMFLEPVGPHDPREIPLPPHKLAQLIPRSTVGAESQSPFSMVSPHGSSAPCNTVSVPGDPGFSAALGDEAVTTVFNPSPFGLMTEPAPIHPPAAETHHPFPGSSHPVSVSPFFSPSAAAQPAVESPFMSAPAVTASSPFSLAPDPLQGSPGGGGAAPFSALSIPAGPFVQSVAGAGSSSEDSSFFSAACPGQPAAFPPIPAAPAPLAADTSPPAAAAPSWGSIFPFQSPAEPANRPLPGVGATFFPVDPGLQGTGPSRPTEGAPLAASGFFGGTGTAATAEGTKPGAGFGGLAGPDDPLPTTPAASWKPSNPFERIQALAKTAESTAELHAASRPTDAASLFGGSALPPGFQSVTPTPAPTQLPETAAASPADREIKLALAASLKNCAAHDLGTSPENIPSWVQFTLSYELVAGQLSTGRVVVPLDAIIAGLDAPIRALFAQARSGLEVELPSNAVFHAVSEATPTPASGPAVALLDPFASAAEIVDGTRPAAFGPGSIVLEPQQPGARPSGASLSSFTQNRSNFYAAHRRTGTRAASGSAASRTSTGDHSGKSDDRRPGIRVPRTGAAAGAAAAGIFHRGSHPSG